MRWLRRLLGHKEGQCILKIDAFLSHACITMVILLSTCAKCKKREKGKLVQGYSSQDLEGILVNRAKSPQSNCNVLDEVKSIENPVPVSEPEPEPEIEGKVLDVPPEWWGIKFGFIAGGLLVSESRRRSSPPTGGDENRDARTTFNKDDRENLYKLVQVAKESLKLKQLNKLIDEHTHLLHSPTSLQKRRLLP